MQETLAAEGVKQALRRPVTVQLSEIDRSRINDSRGIAEGKYLVGVAQQVGTVVDFSSASSLGARISNLNLGTVRGKVNGGFVWTAALEVPGATALRLHLTGVDLPAGAQLYVYNLAGQAFGPYTRRGPLDDGVIHTNTVFGTQLVLQLHAPVDAPAPQLTVAEVGVMGSRFVAPRYSPAGAFEPDDIEALSKAGNLCSGNADSVVNAACQSSSVADTAKDAVASMLFQSGDSFYLCTGGLVADTVTTSVIPYFLTARNCISSGGEASSLETYFDYRATCGSPNCVQPNNNNGDTIGATIKATGSTSDYTLLELASTPVTADGVATYLGWLSTPVANIDNLELYRISHPRGSPQAYSESVVDGKPAYGTLPRGNFIYSRATFGAIEGGSSGSPVLNGAGQIVGQLSGACGGNRKDVCDAGSNGTVDGAFAASYPNMAPFLSPTLSPGTEPGPTPSAEGKDLHGVVRHEGGSRAAPAGMGRPPASYSTPPGLIAKGAGKSRYSASASSSSGNSLAMRWVRPSRVYRNSGGYYTWCDELPVWGGMDYGICASVSIFDPAMGDKSTTNNSALEEIYDACGTRVHWATTYGWHDIDFFTGGPLPYFSGRTLTGTVQNAGAGSCFGTWLAVVTYTQTFSDGVTLTVSGSQPYTMYGSYEDYRAAEDASNAPQPPPTGGPVEAGEQFGGPSDPGAEQADDSESEKPTRCKGAGDPVDTASGNFWHTFCDLAIPGRGPALDLSRTYNALAAATDGPFGFGWSSSYDMSLTIDPSTVVVHQESGAQARFSFDGTRWTAPPRVLATLEHNADGTWTFTRQSRAVFTFDASGRLTAVADLNGYRTTVDYPSASAMVVTDPAGRSLTFTFTGPHVTSVQDSSSPARSLSYDYDAAGNLTDVVDVGGGHWQFTYDGEHRMLTMRSPRYYGDTTTTPSPVLTNRYDDAGRVDWQSDPLGRVTTFDYTSIPGSTKVTDPKGNSVVYGYTDSLLTTITSGGAKWYYRYDPDTLGRISEFDPNLHTTTSTYDGAGNLTSRTDGLGRTTSYTYNALRQVTSVTEPKQVNGQPITTTMTYDSAGNLRTVSAPLLDGTGATIATATTTYHYDDPAHPGDVTSVTDPNGHTTLMSYDAFGGLTSITDAVGNTTTHGYDTDRGWRTSTVSPRGNVGGTDPADYTILYAYDAYGRPTVTRDPMWTATAPAKHQTVRAYDADGNLASFTDGDGHTTTYAYNAAGERVSATRPDGTVLRTDYWPDGTLRRQYDGAGQATSYTYDSRGQLASITDPLGRTTRFGYDAVGNLLLGTDPSGRTTKQTYDAADQIIAVDYSDPATPDVTNISYDADGQRVSMTDGTGTTTWTWDTLNRMTSTTNGAGQTVGYHYDLGGRLTAIDYPGNTGTVTRSYDDAGRLTGVTDWNNRQTTFDYDADSQLTRQTYPNGTTATSTYDRTGRPTDIRHATTTNPGAPFASFGYGRSGAGLVTSVTSTGVPADTHTFSYDALHHLAQVDTATYGYDAADNLTKRLDNTQQVFDIANEVAATTTNPPISLVGTASAGDATSGSLTLTLPAGKAPGDQVLLAATLANGKSVTTPTGYTVVGTYASGTSNTAAKVVLYRRTIAAGDSSVTVSFTGKIAKTVALAVYRGVHTTNPIDVVSSGSTAAGTSVTVASLAATVVRDRLVMVTGASGTAGTWSMPADMTARVQRAGGTTDAAIADQALTAVGASGARTATHSTSTQLVGILVALRPAQTSYTYDAQGNRTSIVPVTGTSTTLGYDQANRLTAYGTIATYAYNGGGLRTSKTVSGTTTAFTWDTNQNLPLLLADGTTSYIYGPEGRPLEQVTATATLYYHYDQLGSTRALTNGTGSVVATYSYDPYGNLNGSTGTATNPLRYAGQYTDPETGFQYLRARYYDPATAQFLTRDPLFTVTRDAHGYADRNPLNETDPSGLSPSSWLTTPQDLPNDQFWSGAYLSVTGGIAFGSGMVMVVGGGVLDATGIGAILGVPAQLYGAYQVGAGAGNVVKGVSQMMQARQQPRVCKSPVAYGHDLLANTLPGGLLTAP